MSLLSILNSYSANQSGTSATTSLLQAQLAKAQAQAAAAQTTVSGTTSSATISDDAKLAAAEKADNAKDFGALAIEVRAGLDTQYKAGAEQGKAALGALSGRALASIALNKNGLFSRTEQAQAKVELATRERDTLSAAIGSGMSITTLAAYGTTMASQYDAMSVEERAARGWTAQTRLDVGKIAQGTTVTTLFDQLDKAQN